MSDRNHQMPPGPRWPTAISTLGWWSRPNPLVRRMRARYGDTVSFPIMHEGRWVFIITDAARFDELRRLLPHILEWTSSTQQMLLLTIFGPDKASQSPQVRRALAPVDAAILDEIRRRRSEPDLEERDDILSMLVQ